MPTSKFSNVICICVLIVQVLTVNSLDSAKTGHNNDNIIIAVSKAAGGTKPLNNTHNFIKFWISSL